jgi:hypothetical protein
MYLCNGIFNREGDFFQNGDLRFNAIQLDKLFFKNCLGDVIRLQASLEEFDGSRDFVMKREDYPQWSCDVPDDGKSTFILHIKVWNVKRKNPEKVPHVPFVHSEKPSISKIKLNWN